MSTRSRTRSIPEAARRPLVGRLHELAMARPVTTRADPEGWWQQPRLAGVALIRNPQGAAFARLGRGKSFGRPGRGSKTALMHWLYPDALRFTGQPVVVFDEAASVEPIDLSSANDVVFDPLACGPVLSRASTDAWGEW